MSISPYNICSARDDSFFVAEERINNDGSLTITAVKFDEQGNRLGAYNVRSRDELYYLATGIILNK